MKRNRKFVAEIVAACMCVMVSFPVYAWPWGDGKTETGIESSEKTEYAFTYKDTEIHLNTEAAPVLTALGKAEKTFEQQSCAFQGMDCVYTYPGIEIATYPVNGKEMISSIYITDKSVSTQEGIHFGSTYDEMIKAYGEDYTEEFGVYRYVLGQTELNIYTTDKAVDGIEYLIKTEK